LSKKEVNERKLLLTLLSPKTIEEYNKSKLMLTLLEPREERKHGIETKD